MAADKKISQLPISVTLDGTELVPIVQDGVTVQTTTQDIADLNTPALQNLQSVTNVGSTTTTSITANSFVKSGGTASQFLKANGTVDNNIYITSADIPNSTNLIKQKVRAGENLIKGQVVYASSSNGTEIVVQKGDNRNDPTAGKILGIIDSTTSINNIGFVITEGNFSGIDTSSATIGDPVWLGINGNLIFGLINKPYAPDALVFIGIVVFPDAVSGSIYVKIQNGLKLSENNEVDLITTTPTNNQVLTYESSTGLWKNKTLTIPTQVVPVGGTTGQILAKVDNTDYNLEWIENYANYTSVLKHTVKASVALTKGQAVYVSGASGTNMLVSKASNVSEATSSKTLGLIAQNLAINGNGFVVTEGLLSGLNTNSATIGDPVWLGVDGALIYGLASKPYAPAHLVFIGIVTRVSATVGEIFVKVQNGFELREIHDVDLITTTPSNNEILTFEGSTSLWKNKSVVSALGFTPYNATNPSGYITSSALTPYALIANPTFTTAITTPIINGVSGLLSFKTTDFVSVGNYATPSAQRIFTIGQDTSFVSIGSMIGATSSSAIYMNVATPSVVNYVLRSSGTNVFLNSPSASDSLILSTGGVANRFVITGTFGGASFNAFALLGASNTGQTASTAVSGWNYQSFSRQWATGAITTQNENVWGATTYSFVGASTITNAYGNVFNAPVAGTNATITNNWSALFNGNVVIGSTGQLFEFKQTTNSPTFTQTGATSSSIYTVSGGLQIRMQSFAGAQNWLFATGGRFLYGTSDTQPIEFYTNSVKRFEVSGIGTMIFFGGATFADATNFSFQTTTGTRIGTATNEKLSFWNSTPIVQPTNTTSLNAVLENTGLMASGSTISTINKPLVVGANTTPRTGVATDGVTSVLGDLKTWATNYHSGEVLYSEVSGEALNFGQLCYRNAAGKWQKATGSSSAIAAYNMLGICLQTVGATDTAISILTRGYVESTYLSAGAVGNPLFMSAATAGSITNTAPSTAGNVVRIIGNVFWSSATQTNAKWILYFNPDNTWIEL
jgi:hypothetical protein